MADYYSVLGVSKTAKPEEISKAYRELAKKWHPDKNKDPSAKERFTEINRAYEHLSDPEKKRVYDGGNQGNVPPFFKGFQGTTFTGMPFPGINFHNINLFERNKQSTDSSPILVKIVIGLNELYHGKHISFPLKRSIICKICDGTLSISKKEGTKCCACNGDGYRQVSFGLFKVQQVCNECNRGKIVDDPCSCKTGLNEEETTIEFDIPAGQSEDENIILREKGNISNPNCKVAGDIVITVCSEDTTIYTRKGSDLYGKIELSLSDCLCGWQRSIYHPRGSNLLISVSDICLPDYQIVITGQGLPIVKGGYGDLYLTVVLDYSQMDKVSLKREELCRLLGEENRISYRTDDTIRFKHPEK